MSSSNPSKKPPRDGKSRRGFASMDPARVKEIASLGGKSVPPEKRNFSDPEAARRAGLIGGNRPKPWLRKKFAEPK